MQEKKQQSCSNALSLSVLLQRNRYTNSDYPI